MAPHGPPHRAWRPAAARTAEARRSTIASRRGEQRGASRQSGADPSLSTTRTCLSRSEVACKRAAGAGEREGWQKLPLAAVAGRRARGTSRRGEQRGASRQSGADPSLSTTRTCLSRSEVACKRAAGAGEREGWQKLPLAAVAGRRARGTSRRGEQRGASRQSGADPSLSTTRTCLSRSEVACKRAAGAGEREGWQKLPLARFAPCQLTFPAMCGEEPTTPRMGVFILVDNTT